MNLGAAERERVRGRGARRPDRERQRCGELALLEQARPPVADVLAQQVLERGVVRLHLGAAVLRGLLRSALERVEGAEHLLVREARLRVRPADLAGVDDCLRADHAVGAGSLAQQVGVAGERDVHGDAGRVDHDGPTRVGAAVPPVVLHIDLALVDSVGVVLLPAQHDRFDAQGLQQRGDVLFVAAVEQ